MQTYTDCYGCARCQLAASRRERRVRRLGVRRTLGGRQPHTTHASPGPAPAFVENELLVLELPPWCAPTGRRHSCLLLRAAPDCSLDIARANMVGESWGCLLGHTRTQCNLPQTGVLRCEWRSHNAVKGTRASLFVIGGGERGWEENWQPDFQIDRVTGRSVLRHPFCAGGQHIAVRIQFRHPISPYRALTATHNT